MLYIHVYVFTARRKYNVLLKLNGSTFQKKENKVPRLLCNNAFSDFFIGYRQSIYFLCLVFFLKSWINKATSIVHPLKHIGILESLGQIFAVIKPIYVTYSQVMNQYPSM